MKKTFAAIISLLICFTLSACTGSSHYSDYSPDNTVEEENSNEPESYESEQGYLAPSKVFYSDDKYAGNPKYHEINIKCDDLESGLKQYLDSYYIKKNIKILVDEIPPDYFVPIAKAIEKTDIEGRLELKQIRVAMPKTIYTYIYDGKECLEFTFSTADKSGFPVNEDELFIPDKFTTPKEVTGVEPNEFDYCYMGNRINGNIVKYSFKFSSRETDDVDIVIGDYQLQINKQYPWESELPYFLFDEEQLSAFIKNLEDVIYNEIINYN